ncbi:MAG: transposase, partial [Clostridia bacterium]|nr:transposase [Clostridia bacterium]
SVRLLGNVLEEIDYTELYGAYSRKEKICAVSPKNLFKILVYAYMNHLYSSRDIETACKRDINFMYLLEGAKAPDHNTIARFRSTRLKNIIDNLFGQVVLLLKDYGELSCENLFVDGTKRE